MRVLRALSRLGGRIEHVQGELLVGDRRTSDALLTEAGLATDLPDGIVTFDSFLAHQRFVTTGHPLVQALKVMAKQAG